MSSSPRAPPSPSQSIPGSPLTEVADTDNEGTSTAPTSPNESDPDDDWDLAHDEQPHMPIPQLSNTQQPISGEVLISVHGRLEQVPSTHTAIFLTGQPLYLMGSQLTSPQISMSAGWEELQQYADLIRRESNYTPISTSTGPYGIDGRPHRMILSPNFDQLLSLRDAYRRGNLSLFHMSARENDTYLAYESAGDGTQYQLTAEDLDVIQLDQEDEPAGGPSHGHHGPN